MSLVLGLFARRYGAVVRRKEGLCGWSVDWYHILIGPTFVFLALISGSIVRTQVWMSVYLILLALYLLQYAALPRLRKYAATSALAILGWAWWVQKLISWPEWLELGMQILPVAGMAAILPFIWGRNRGTMWLGRIVHTACLFPVSYPHLDVYKRQGHDRCRYDRYHAGGTGHGSVQGRK